MLRDELVKMTKKELLVIAKELQIVGRHEKHKATLIGAILMAQDEAERTADIIEELTTDAEAEWETPMPKVIAHKPAAIDWEGKSKYLSNAQIGTIIAFKVDERKAISGKIDEIHKHNFVVVTKNGVKFTVSRKDVIWVKTGARWPRGVYEALKGKMSNEYKIVNQRN